MPVLNCASLISVIVTDHMYFNENKSKNADIEEMINNNNGSKKIVAMTIIIVTVFAYDRPVFS